MSEGVFTIPKVNSLIGNDFTRTSSGTAVGTAGILLVPARLGRLYRLRVINGSATAYYLQVFDTAAAPTNGATPMWSQRLAVSGDVEMDFTNCNGLYFASGLAFAISSTPGLLTLAAANDVAFYGALYTRNP